MNRDKQIKSSDWLIKEYSQEELMRMKEEAIKEAEVELMADILCEAKEHDCKGGNDCLCVKQAEALYNANYRKVSEVINEFVKELIKRFNDLEYNANTPRKTVKVDELRAQVDWILHEVTVNTIKEFAEKYVEAIK